MGRRRRQRRRHRRHVGNVGHDIHLFHQVAASRRVVYVARRRRVTAAGTTVASGFPGPADLAARAVQPSATSATDASAQPHAGTTAAAAVAGVVSCPCVERTIAGPASTAAFAATAAASSPSSPTTAQRCQRAPESGPRHGESCTGEQVRPSADHPTDCRAGRPTDCLSRQVLHLAPRYSNHINA